MNCSDAKFYENYLTSDFHINTVISRRVCLPIKMASKTVIRSMKRRRKPQQAFKKVQTFKGWFRLELTDNCWFQVNKNGARDVLSCSGFAEKGVEGIVPASNGLVAWHLAIGLNSMLQAVKFPTRITNLHSGLADMN